MPSSKPSPLARLRPLQRALAPLAAMLLMVAAVAQAQPNPILGPGRHDCPEATLPLRVATLQAPGATEVDPLAWVAIDEFKAFNAAVAPRARNSAIHVVVLAYLAGDPVDIEVLLTPFGASEPTWRTVITPSLPPFSRGMHLFPYYFAATIDRRDYRSAFPVEGPYHLVARPAQPVESAYVYGFCSAETSSWVLVRP